MTETPESAPAGWYDDPHMPGRMRYFDGVAWTNHFHSPDKAPDVGSWVNSTFSVFAKHWPGALVLAFVATFVGNVVAWFTFRAVFDDLVLIDEGIENFSAAKAIALIVVAIFGILWQGLGWLALNRFMQRAHHQADPTVGEAVTHAFRRLPRYLGIVLVLTLAMVLIAAVVVALAIAQPIIAIFAVLLLIVGGVWAFVKLSFLPAAIVAAPTDTGALRASADVSSGRFWGSAGRVIVFSVALGFAGNIVAAILGEYGSAVDADAVTGIFEVEGEDLVVNDFSFGQLFPSTGKLMVIMVITSVLRAVSSMISTSAFMRLYLDVGAPSEL